MQYRLPWLIKYVSLRTAGFSVTRSVLMYQDILGLGEIADIAGEGKLGVWGLCPWSGGLGAKSGKPFVAYIIGSKVLYYL